jgi:ectoine hydroxylase-related dioxygenase (phytanoyl-CoA dioxygenase family)
MTVGKPITIKVKKGTAILFNADMAHAAATYYTKHRHCIQYKICHYDDIMRLNHLNKQHIIKKNNISNKIKLSEYYLARISHKYLLLVIFLNEKTILL